MGTTTLDKPNEGAKTGPKTGKGARINMPDGNPTKRLGTLMPAEGENGVFAQSWYPVCLSSEVGPGEVRGEAFLDGKIVIFRGEDGQVSVVSAYCPHVGADLSVGCVEGDNLQCAFHKWEFDGKGQCMKTGIGDPAPKAARLYTFPSQERYGLIWAFNGDEPLWDIPDFEYPDETLITKSFRMPAPFKCDPWVFAANTPDMQHLKVVHQLKFADEDPHKVVDWDDWGFRYWFRAEHQMQIPIEWTVGIRGTTIFWQEGPYDDFWLGGIVGFGLPRPGEHLVFVTLAVEAGDGSDAAMKKAEERMAIAETIMERTIGEDYDILNTIHYRPGALTKGDTTLSRYLDFVRSYPRAHPSGPFIK